MNRKCPHCGKPVASESEFGIFMFTLAIGFIGMVMGCGFWFLIQQAVW